ncbi:MAG TPA: hypothetical protein VK788_27190 [Terriglobales bacterium]|jgi:hypothetical protein|nr:hypothetical protein [Terriglobales bacterium]
MSGFKGFNVTDLQASLASLDQGDAAVQHWPAKKEPSSVGRAPSSVEPAA